MKLILSFILSRGVVVPAVNRGEDWNGARPIWNAGDPRPSSVAAAAAAVSSRWDDTVPSCRCFSSGGRTPLVIAIKAFSGTPPGKATAVVVESPCRHFVHVLIVPDLARSSTDPSSFPPRTPLALWGPFGSEPPRFGIEKLLRSIADRTDGQESILRIRHRVPFIPSATVVYTKMYYERDFFNVKPSFFPFEFCFFRIFKNFD